MIQSPVTREAMSRGSAPPHTHTHLLWQWGVGERIKGSVLPRHPHLLGDALLIMSQLPFWGQDLTGQTSETLQRQGIPFKGHFQSAQGRTSATGPICGCLCPHNDEPGKRASRETCAVGPAAVHSKSRCRDSAGRRGAAGAGLPITFPYISSSRPQSRQSLAWGKQRGKP